MLPDLPLLKRDLQARLDRYLYAQANGQLDAFSESPRRMIHEGNRLRVLRADGSSDESTLVQTRAEILVMVRPSRPYASVTLIFARRPSLPVLQPGAAAWIS